MMAIDIHWTTGGQKLYRGELVGMLDKIYRRLFCRGENKQNNDYRIVLNEKTREIDHASSDQS